MQNGDAIAKSPKFVWLRCRSRPRGPAPKIASRWPSAAVAPTTGCWYFAKCKTATHLPSPFASPRRSAKIDCHPKLTVTTSAEMDKIGSRHRYNICHRHTNSCRRSPFRHRFRQFRCLKWLHPISIHLYSCHIFTFFSADSRHFDFIYIDSNLTQTNQV